MKIWITMLVYHLFMAVEKSEASLVSMCGKKMQHNDDSRAVITEITDIPILRAFSVCMWLKCESSHEWNTVSYAVPNRPNEISVIGRSGSKITLYIKNIDQGNYNHQFTDGEWHHLCMTWRSSDGELQLLQDAVVIASDNGVETGEYIAGGGSFIIGQEQDSVGGSFDASQSFVGEVSHYNIWDHALSLDAINDAMACDYAGGNVFAWCMDMLSVYEMVQIGNDDSSCARICETPPHVTHAELSTSCSDEQNYDSQCTYVCDLGYEAVTSLVTRCEYNGHWSVSTIICVITTCGLPPSGTNTGFPSCTNHVSYGSKCTYRCNTGYYAVTSLITTCNSEGEWSIDNIRCNIITCYYRPYTLNAELSSCTYDTNYGSQCTYRCDTGYEDATPSAVTCGIDGNWDIDFVHCNTITCHTEPHTINAELSSCTNGMNYGSQCTYRCRVGYEAVTSLVTSCESNMQWNTTRIMCNVTTCGLPPSGTNTGFPSCTNHVSHGSHCTYRCNTGYYAVTSLITTCNSGGKWSIDNIRCNIILCYDAPLVVAAELSYCTNGMNYGSQCTYRCHVGYEAVTSLVTSCESNMQWNTTRIVCNESISPMVTNKYNATQPLTDASNDGNISTGVLVAVALVCLGTGIGLGLLIGYLKLRHYTKKTPKDTCGTNVTNENNYATLNLNEIVTNVYEVIQKPPIYQNPAQLRSHSENI